MSGTLTPPLLSPVDVLARTDFFAGLTSAQLELVSGVSRFETYEESVQIYRHGDTALDFYVLVDGMVRFAVGFGSRDASKGDILRRGKVFGWAALTPATNQRIATASCLTPCTVLAIDGPALVALLERDHTLGFRVMKQLNLLITSTLSAYAAG